jgi:hypothetical protein
MDKKPIIEFTMTNNEYIDKIKSILIYSNIDYEMHELCPPEIVGGENINNNNITNSGINETDNKEKKITRPYKKFYKFMKRIINNMKITSQPKPITETQPKTPAEPINTNIFQLPFTGPITTSTTQTQTQTQTQTNTPKKTSIGIMERLNKMYHLFDTPTQTTDKKDNTATATATTPETVETKNISILTPAIISEPPSQTTEPICKLKIHILENVENQPTVPNSGKTYNEIMLYNKLSEISKENKENVDVKEFIEKIDETLANFKLEDEDREHIKGTKEYYKMTNNI